MKKLIRSRKGVDAFTLVLTILSVCVLMVILIGLTMKYNNLANTIGGAGSSASLVLSAYDKADSALLYLDNAVGLSMQSAIYDLAYNGFYPAEGSSCGVTPDNYVKWSEGSAVPASGICEAAIDKCIPGNYDSFNAYFIDKLNQHVKAYNENSEVKLPENNYELYLSRPGEIKSKACIGEGDGCFEGKISGPLQLVGIARQQVVVKDSRVNYTVMPSFRENSDVDLIGDFGKIVPKAEGLIGVDESGVKGVMKSYTEETGLMWDVENYGRVCDNACNVGEDCEVCREECEDVEVECGVEDADCTGTERICKTVCYPGRLIHYYCNVNAGIGVRIIDAGYDKGNGDGYMAFVTSESGKTEVKEYDYRFGLNWVEMAPAPVCVQS